jgi:hypothetical protein
MTRPSSQHSDADAPLRGEAPAPDQLRDPSPEGTHPNASEHFGDKPQYHGRPAKYPAAKASKSRT